jgi:hypothetical protein
MFETDESLTASDKEDLLRGLVKQNASAVSGIRQIIKPYDLLKVTGSDGSEYILQGDLFAVVEDPNPSLSNLALALRANEMLTANEDIFDVDDNIEVTLDQVTDIEDGIISIDNDDDPSNDYIFIAELK